MEETKWKETVILVDADYVNKVAFDLIVNFERMLGRRIPQADMATWLECVALDGGLKGLNEQKYAEIIVRLSTLLRFATEIKEIDINPLLADDKDVVAVDARILIEK